MSTFNHKAKQYLLVALKVFILAFTFGYIYLKITRNESLDLQKFALHIFDRGNNSILYFLFFIALATTNWFFEILKWKTIVSVIQSLSFLNAMKQSLISLTVSLATPNRVGEYGAKVYFFEPVKRKTILLLNFFSNFMQMGVTTLFGIIGILIISEKYNLPFSGLNLAGGLFIVSILIILGCILKKQQLIIKELTISNVISKFKKLPVSIKSKTIVYSVIRYLIFSFLFYRLLIFFGASISFIEFIPLIFTMYFIVSILPSIFIFDVVVRGGAALWVFSLAGVPEIPILSTVLTMWFLNFVIPSIFGSYYLFTYKPDAS